MRKTGILLLAMTIALAVLSVSSMSAGTSAEAAAFQTAAHEDRVSGTIVRSNPEKSILVVKESKSDIERTVLYSSATKWTKGTGVPVDMKEFKDGSRVICLGKLNEKGELAATRIDLQ